MGCIVHVASEVFPYSKTGGLADVVGALPEAQARLGHRTHVITPLHRMVRDAGLALHQTNIEFPVTIGARTSWFQVFRSDRPRGTVVWLLQCDEWFDRETLYGPRGQDYPDNGVRFAFFAAAALRALDELDLRPDVVHGHDWQAGLLPLQLALSGKGHPRRVFTIHNLAYQGNFPPESLSEMGIPGPLFHPEGVEFYGNVSCLKTGIVFSDQVNTVSPTYAREVLTPERGAGMDGVLRALGDRFRGILNGIDQEVWSPETDPWIPARYSAADLAGKTACREALCQEVDLPVPRGPLFGMVGRMDRQKGHDLVIEALRDLLLTGGSVVVLGSGDKAIQDRWEAARREAPDRVAVRFGLDEALAHRIEAGADVFLMPSEFEPCGLNQMFSLRYGTLPIVRAVGGLADTVVDVDEDPAGGTGIRFRSFDREALGRALLRAGWLWKDPDQWNQVQRRGMAQDFSWDRSARAYDDLYRAAEERRTR
ncbi:MAG TPA: glycogen synthase GlgA [Myxococcota bacterium]|nr:glycogen synthase GlgA [Myxococcota bacterium]HQK52079.1 glycogen synthase GlgA [Myxococcota bacterium]